MDLIDIGAGVPIVIIPGIQGYRDSLRPVAEAIARAGCRAIVYSLLGTDETRSAGVSREFDVYVDQLDEVRRSLGLGRHITCGWSFGGLVALRDAARRPADLCGLTLAAAPALHVDRSRPMNLFRKVPWLFGPVFVLTAPLVFHTEVVRAVPHFGKRFVFRRRAFRRAITHRMSARRISRRLSLAFGIEGELAADCARVAVPALVLSGEPELDHVVDPSAASEYTRLIRNARHITVPDTGHLGILTRPGVYAAHLASFARQVVAEAARERAARTA